MQSNTKLKRKKKVSIQELKFLCKWINNLRLTDASVDTSNLYESFMSGYLLSQIVQNLIPSAKFLNLNVKIVTKKAAIENLEQSLGFILRGKFLVEKTMLPTSEEIYNGCTNKLSELLMELIRVYVIKPLHKNIMKNMLTWYNDILALYDTYLYLQESNVSFKTKLHGAVPIFYVIYHFCGPVEIRNENRVVFVDPLRVYQNPITVSELRSNVKYIFSLLNVLGISLLFDIDDWLTNESDDFFMLQLSYVYEHFICYERYNNFSSLSLTDNKGDYESGKHQLIFADENILEKIIHNYEFMQADDNITNKLNDSSVGLHIANNSNYIDNTDVDSNELSILNITKRLDILENHKKMHMCDIIFRENELAEKFNKLSKHIFDQDHPISASINHDTTDNTITRPNTIEFEKLEIQYRLLEKQRHTLNDYFSSRIVSIKNEIIEMLSQISRQDCNNIYCSQTTMKTSPYNACSTECNTSSNISMENVLNRKLLSTSSLSALQHLSECTSCDGQIINTSQCERKCEISVVKHKAPWITPIVKDNTSNTYYQQLLQNIHSQQNSKKVAVNSSSIHLTQSSRSKNKSKKANIYKIISADASKSNSGDISNIPDDYNVYDVDMLQLPKEDEYDKKKQMEFIRDKERNFMLVEDLRRKKYLNLLNQ